VRRRPRQPLAEPEALDAILGRTGENRFARSRPPFDTKLWRDAVGARISERAQPIAIQDGSLLLRVPNSVWAHELSMLSEDVCSRLRERGVEVRRLRFRVGDPPLAERRPEPRISRSVPAVRALPAELTHTLGAVGDEGLREAIAAAAAANLAWQSVAGPAPELPVSEARRAARAPRGAGSETAPPARTSQASREGAPRSPSSERGRRR
jgi:hypothetical protein